MNIKPIVSIIIFTGIVFGRKILGAIDRNILDDILIIGLVVVAFFFALGTIGILRYYLTIKARN